MFTSLPVVPPEPQSTIYPVYPTLSLFREFGSREEYQSATGEQAPPWDPNAPMQGWRDDSATNDPSPYFVAAKPGTQTMGQSLSVPLSQARKVNLPGAYSWPTYSYSSGSIVVVNNTLTSTVRIPIDQVGAVVCLGADAGAIAAEIAAALSIQAVVFLDTSWNYDYGSDTRRAWKVAFSNGFVTMAGALIAAKAVQGVGAPGYWSLVSSGAPEWNPTPDPGIAALSDPSTHANKRPCPIRPLHPDESFGGVLADTPFTLGTPMITRTPAGVQGGLPAPASPLDTLTASQQAFLVSMAKEMGWL